MSATRKRLGTIAWVLFGAAGLAFMAKVVWDARDQPLGEYLPPWPALAAAVAVTVGAVLLAGRSWTQLAADHPGPGHRRAFYVAQLGRYIPGPLWQWVGQAGLTSRAGVPLPRAVAALPVHAAALVVAGGTVTVLMVAAPAIDPVMRAASTAGIALLPLLHRRWMRWAVSPVRRWTKDDPGDLVPAQGRIVAAWLWSAASIAVHGIAFALVAASAPGLPTLLGVMGAFAAAWTAGFVAVPFPAGLGVREAVLVAVLGSAGVPAAAVVAASAIHRLVTMGAEAIVLAAVAARGSNGRGRTSQPGTLPPEA